MAHERRQVREALADANARLALMRQGGAPSADLEGSVAKIEAALGVLLPELEEEHGTLQQNPLAQRDESARADDDDEALVPVDPGGALLALAELGLGGPCRGAGAIGTYLFDAMILVCWGCQGYWALGMMRLIDPSLEQVGRLFASVAVVIGACTLYSARVQRSMLSDGESALRRLLKAEVSAEKAEYVAAVTRKIRVGNTLSNVVGPCIIMSAIFYFLWDEVTPDVVLAAVAFWFASALTQGPNIPDGALVNAPCAIVEDTARRLALEIKKTPSSECDFSELLHKVDALGDDIDRAARFIAPSLAPLLAIMLGLPATFLTMAFGPRPNEANHWFNVYNPPWLCVLLAGSGLSLMLWQSFLMFAAITAECDNVRAELNKLRYEDRQLADPDTLTRVEALERYIDSKGLGFQILGARISYSFVYEVLLQAFSILSVLLPVLLVQLQQPSATDSGAASLSE